MSDEILGLDEVCQLLDKPEATIKRYARESLLTNIGDEEEFKFNKVEVMRYLDFQKRLG
ncbi:DNA-binding protein [Shewanella sp. VB17]|uniref:DNA-binding protein n=1 Tax=Shewanella sp. VB17 TaxID=2739432 RepID=UPI001563EB5E|nr:DNA-binding protein [Shewanella sp. VB17]NRD75312.1 DNA-binding protein [Shewanella sp. VB17]